MPLIPLIWVAGILGVGWAAGEAADALDSTERLTRTVVVVGSIYVGYRVLQSAGFAK